MAFNGRGRPRKWDSQAERQAAYREKKDVSMELRELRLYIKRAGERGEFIQFDPCTINADESPEQVLRAVVKQLRERYHWRPSL